MNRRPAIVRAGAKEVGLAADRRIERGTIRIIVIISGKEHRFRENEMKGNKTLKYSV